MTPSRSALTRTLAALTLGTLLGSGTAAFAADEATEVPFEASRWRLEADEARFESHLGRASLRLKGGAAWAEGASFSDGVIEFDIAFGPERGFCGLAWRAQAGGTFEHFYLRPHQSGKPDSMQYTPNFHGVAGWQLYHGPGYGAAVELPFHEWIPVRIVVSGGRAEAYVGSDEPVLVMHDLKLAPESGGLGLVVGNFSPAYFSRFRYRSVETPELRGRPAPVAEAPAGSVRAWAISTVFDGARLDGRFALEASDTDGLEWTRLAAEPSGIANMARLQGVAEGSDTAFARLALRAPSARDVTLHVGYSDRVRVYLNGRLLYSGDNGYQSRDFRYLGTIGLFDALPLRLAEGENELLLAVGEAFGGWGIQAALDGAEGVEVVAR